MNKPSDIAVGQPWTFVSSDGRRTSYVVEDVEEAQLPSSIVKLLNPATRKLAQVTTHWLRSDDYLTGRWEYDAA